MLWLAYVVVSPLVQLFPGDAPPGPTEARLEAARGEYEPFQILVRGPLKNVRARAESWDLPAPSLARVGYYDVKTPSSVEGRAGAWPDPLIPDIDELAHEKRNAFPFDVPAGEARAIWVQPFVPRDARPGEHAGAIVIEAGGPGATERARVPIKLMVHKTVLPASSSLPVTFGWSARAVGNAKTQRYTALLFLRHRISLHGGLMDPPEGGDFRAYDAEVGPFLDGKADPGGPADGARWTAIDLRVPWRLDEKARAASVREQLAHLQDRGWLDRAFAYVYDEPAPAQMGEVRSRAAFLARVAPGVPRLVTTTHDPSLGVDLFCPIVNFVDDKPGNSRCPPRERYPRLWWYQACMSHGCDDAAVPEKLRGYFTGWPSLVIDAPAISHRILEWLAWRYRIAGELYYNVVEAQSTGHDPWRDQLLHGGHGDGTLIYPGAPERIGGKTPIPVASIRLELVREGLEDYELLRLHEQRFGRSATDGIARPIAEKTWRWTHDPSALEAARRRLLADLDR
jgi:hypothetical protein